MGLQFFNKSFDLNIKEGKLTFLTIVCYKKTLWVHYTYLKSKFSGKVYRFRLLPGQK